MKSGFELTFLLLILKRTKSNSALIRKKLQLDTVRSKILYPELFVT